MKPIKIKIDPANRRAHVDSILSYLEISEYRIESKATTSELGFYCDNVVAIFGSTMGYITYTLNEQAYDLSNAEELFVGIVWIPQNGETIEVLNDDKWNSGRFIGMDGGMYVVYHSVYGFSGWTEARQISPIHKEIAELEEKLKELKARL